MGTIQQIHTWSLTHHPRWLVVLRVSLGLCLFIKGFSFMANATIVERFIEYNPLFSKAWWLPIAITWAHMLGGVLIIVGLLTRYAVLLQIPILLGAVIFLTKNSVLGSGGELIFTILVLLLLVFFLIEGGGPLSLDDYFRKIPKE
ncbi:MAG: DoxX family protein [Flavitalea sp.]